MATLTAKKPKNTYKDLLQVSNANAGVDATLRQTEDGEGTAAALHLSTTQVGAEDGAVGAPGFCFGDDADNGLYRIGTNNWAAAAAGAKVWETSAAGEITMALQPSFLATPTAAATDATGDGTAISPVVFGTESYDRNADFASNVFTAPVTGIYDFSVGISLGDVNNGTTHTRVLVELITTAKTFSLVELNPTGMDVSNVLRLNFSVVGASMTATDTAQVRLLVSGGTKIVDVNTESWFSGRLVA